ncbi:MAG: beta-lactamase family protein [Chloroflexota bacterium]|nr:beta-lactamase family protein [Chloroflexota bacterium]
MGQQRAAPMLGEVVGGGLGRRLDAYLRRAAPFGFSGAVLVAREGKIVLHGGYGLADRSRGRPIGPQTVFDVGSVTKLFTAAAILKLEEQGRLRVDDSVASFFDDVPPDKVGITLHHLLTHTAGLPLYSGEDEEPVERNPLIRRVLDAPLEAPPGTRYRYSNPGYSLLGVVIELVSGRPYETYLREHLFGPAGMEQTGYVGPQWDRDRFARGYTDDEDWGTPPEHGWLPDGPGWNLRANGGMLATVGDLYRWQRAFSDGILLSADSTRKAATPYVPAPSTPPPGASSGYGLYVSAAPGGGQLVSRGGNNGYFMAELRHYVDDDVVLTMATNEDHYALRALQETFASMALGARPALPPPARGTGPAVSLEEFVGTYVLPSGATLVAARVGDRLVLEPRGQEAVDLLAAAPPEGSALRRELTARAAAIVEASGRRDFQPLRAETTPERFDRYRPFLTHLWQAAAGDGRPAPGYQALGTVAAWPGFEDGVWTILRRQGQGARATVRVVWRDGQVVGLGARGIDSPARTGFVPSSGSEFVGFHLGVQRPVSLRFQRSEAGRVTELTVQTGHGEGWARRLSGEAIG